MSYMHFYNKEQVDKYLMALRDGKVDVKDALEAKRAIYDYSKQKTSVLPSGLTVHIGQAPFNPHYLTPFVAYDCRTEVGTCVGVIKPDN